MNLHGLIEGCTRATCRHLAFRVLVQVPVPATKPVRCLDCLAEFASEAELEAERAARPIDANGDAAAGSDADAGKGAMA